ncbi:MAG: fibronectin type III domain-containing protein, partial [Gaiellaceae bacterium]
PGAPGTPSLTPVSPTPIDLTWAAASDNVVVTLNRIERCSGAGCSVFGEVGTSTSTSFSNTGLTASSSYTYRVRAQDAALNLGPYSATATASTPAPPDTELPGAPGTPSLTPVSPTQIDLTWAAASDNVGVTLYRIERCSGAGCSVFGEVGTSTSTSFANTGLTASTSYTYRVRAEDAALNLGAYSSTATASTPSGVLAPVEPLPIVDSFNRRNENPLANGWSNGIGGSVETGLRVNSNTVQCTKATTCTAWRTNPAFGPDTEVWARVSTLPGNGNQFRLYARLQNAGLAAHSGYVLRTNQLAGTDQVMLERIDAGTTVTRLTIPQELVVGDTLLLRVKGSALEAWLKRGSTWTLLGSVADTTYGAAGRVGIGIRGKTGRLDDFGAR